MTIELRVLSGSRAGIRESFIRPVVTVGRHSMSDLRFDPLEELDVSTRHAEFHNDNGVWTVSDAGSTNGTFLNGERIASPRRISDGDIVSFGAKGPRVEIQGVGGSAGGPPRTSVAAAPAPRMNTELRVAAKVKEQTQSMHRSYLIALVSVVVVAAAGFFFWQRQVSAREAVLSSSFARSDSTLKAMEQQLALAKPGDSATTASLRAELEARKQEIEAMNAQIKAGTATKGSVDAMSKKMDQTAAIQRTLAGMDIGKVSRANDGAVAMVASDFDGKYIAGTAFGVSKSGLLVTNRHVVRSAAGVNAKRILVIYANTSAWLPVHVVRVGDGDDDDLALLQIDVAGSYPVVAGVSREGSLATVGSPVLSIGYPGATDLPMEGSGMKITARTTSTAGIVSKRLDNVIQLDSYSAHGASGSPLFDRDGNVVGVIYGGDGESHGKIVYAVPAQKIAAFLGSDGATVLR
ncbi:MAG: Methylcrotonyl-CoA carboxylase biotin-containing subunit protein [Gemmatimonadetes bacterium]|nr:Methylcrotonyl-CoA carboxylase biotin-containing subunit protein [Gemmatimonadota bacterium]